MLNDLKSWKQSPRGWGKAVVSLLACMVVSVGALAVDGQDLARDFDHANRLYEQGKYDEAIAGYRALLQSGHASAALYFNLGNAFLKSGHPGAAIANYRVAQRLSPRDPDIAANLRFARESAGEINRPGRRWERLVNILRVNELTLGTAGLVWLWLGLLAFGQYRPGWGRSLRSARSAVTILALAAIAWTVLLSQTRLSTSVAVVTAREATVRYGPFEEAQTSYTLKDGAELTVLDRKDNWVQVQDGSRRTGWLHAKDVEILPRG